MPDNVKLFCQIVEGFNRGDLSVADEICASDFVERVCARADVPL